MMLSGQQEEMGADGIIWRLQACLLGAMPESAGRLQMVCLATRANGCTCVGFAIHL
jgi:hypothetical protein